MIIRDQLVDVIYYNVIILIANSYKFSYWKDLESHKCPYKFFIEQFSSSKGDDLFYLTTTNAEVTIILHSVERFLSLSLSLSRSTDNCTFDSSVPCSWSILIDTGGTSNYKQSRTNTVVFTGNSSTILIFNSNHLFTFLFPQSITKAVAIFLGMIVLKWTQPAKEIGRR